MTFDEYETHAAKTAIYPDRGENLIYPVLGLASEAGEVAGKLKKVIRDDNYEMTPEARERLVDELGDVLWYVAACCFELDVTMAETAARNVTKLHARNEQNTIGGSGDER